MISPTRKVFSHVAEALILAINIFIRLGRMTKRANILQLVRVIDALWDYELGELDVEKSFTLRCLRNSLESLRDKLAVERTERILKTNPDFLAKFETPGQKHLKPDSI